MQAYQADAESHGATVALNAHVVSADVSGASWTPALLPRPPATLLCFCVISAYHNSTPYTGIVRCLA